MPACRNRIANGLASVTVASSVAFAWVGAAVRGYRRTAAGMREYNRPFCDSHHIGRSPVQAYYPTNCNLRAEVMIIATSGTKTPETPARTVIAWFPPPSALRRGADGSVAIVPPSGWAICDGTKGTSNVSDRFIIDGLRKAGGKLASAGHDHGVKTDPAESIPALVTLIYIMKL